MSQKVSTLLVEALGNKGQRMREQEQESFVHPDDIDDDINNDPDDDTSLVLFAHQILYFKGKRAQRIRATALCSKRRKVSYLRQKRNSDFRKQMLKKKKQLRRERFIESEECYQW